MKTHIFLLYILFSYSLLAQEKSVNVNDENKFQIGITGSADVAYRSLFIVEDHPQAQDNISFRNENEVFKIGYSGGLQFSFLLNDRIVLSSGLQYSNMGYKKETLLTFGFDPRRSPLTGSLYDYSFFNFHFVELPIGVQYRPGKKSIKPLLGIGLSPGYMVNATIIDVREFDDDVIRDKNQMNLSSIERFSLLLFANIGVNYQINETWSVQASAQFRYNVFTVFDEPISTNLWNAGLQLGCFYSW